MSKKKSASFNRQLQRLLGASEPLEDYPNFQTSTFACLHDKIETLIREEIGSEILDSILEEKVSTYELRSQNEALKNPEVLSEVLADAHQREARAATLDEIVDHIFALVDQEARQIVKRAA